MDVKLSRSYLFLIKTIHLYLIVGYKQFIFDIDNNKYLDLINALGSVSIGYGIKSINKEISKGLNNGITFSLTHPLELKVANLIQSCVKSAEMIRFAKNGSDVTTAAIRLRDTIPKKK